MKTGKILKVGNSLAVVVSKKHTRQLGWKEGDVVGQVIVNDQIVLQCIDKPAVRFMHTTREYGDVRAERT